MQGLWGGRVACVCMCEDMRGLVHVCWCRVPNDARGTGTSASPSLRLAATFASTARAAARVDSNAPRRAPAQLGMVVADQSFLLFFLYAPQLSEVKGCASLRSA